MDDGKSWGCVSFPHCACQFVNIFENGVTASAKVVQTWLKNNTPDFISNSQWPSASPDLNPLDYAIWSKLETKVCSKPHTSVEALKRSLTRKWGKIRIETLRASVEDWRPRL